MNKKQANKIYDIMVLDGGANPSNRESFVRYVTTEEHIEWRFCGSLGFGGKFNVGSGRIYVSCYTEDETPERRATIQLINSKLEAL